MTRLLSITTMLAFVACADQPDDRTEQPPFGDDERIGSSADGKADGGSTVRVQARTSGYRSADEYIGPEGFIPGSTCFDTWYDVEVTYENKSLPWGVKLEIVSAMQGVEWSPDDVNNTYIYNYFDWKYEERAAAPSVGPWQWRASRGQWVYSGGGSFDSMHFAVRIVYPDGTVRWDNGGSAWGYYEVKPPGAPCEMSWTPYASTTPTNSQTVTARVVQKW